VSGQVERTRILVDERIVSVHGAAGALDAAEWDAVAAVVSDALIDAAATVTAVLAERFADADLVVTAER
jgi:hypothetical protein